MRLFVALAGFMCWIASVQAGEVVNGDDEAVTRAGNMHTCRAQQLVSGINVTDNWFLCSQGYGPTLSSSRVTAPTDQRTITGGRGAGTNMLSCRDNEMIVGIHVDNNQFRCVAVDSVTAARLRDHNFSPNPRDLRFVEQPSDVADRGRMMTCPRGFVMMGAHFSLGVLACARPPVCGDNANCESGKTCQSLFSGRQVSSLIRVCK